jgi:hypothetical protein
LRLFKPERPSDAPQTRRGMGDIFAIRMLDTILRDVSNIRSAVVILQSETALRYFEDHRTLAGLVGEWTRLPSSNPNRCFFVFSSENYAALAEIAAQLPVPELRNAILQAGENIRAAGYILRIPTPEKNELKNLVLRHQQRYALYIQENELRYPLRRMESGDQKSRYWQGKLLEVDQFNLEISSRRAGSRQSGQRQQRVGTIGCIDRTGAGQDSRESW